VTPTQCREARDLLGWTRKELAEKADVPVPFITSFEEGGDAPGADPLFETRVHSALSRAGAQFPREYLDGQWVAARVYLARE
jgi:transcriptional regulator with XRE-family HTH domain